MRLEEVLTHNPKTASPKSEHTELWSISIMTLKREAIVLASTIVGVNIVGVALHSNPVQSLDCFAPFQQAAAKFAPRPVERPDVPWGQPITSAWDVRSNKTIPLYREGEAPEIPHVAQNGEWVEGKAETTPMPPAVAPRIEPESAPLPVVEPPPPPKGWKPISGSIQPGMIETVNGLVTEEEYTAMRRGQ
jgi:hypothetical protein